MAPETARAGDRAGDLVGEAASPTGRSRMWHHAGQRVRRLDRQRPGRARRAAPLPRGTRRNSHGRDLSHCVRPAASGGGGPHAAPASFALSACARPRPDHVRRPGRGRARREVRYLHEDSERCARAGCEATTTRPAAASYLCLRLRNQCRRTLPPVAGTAGEQRNAVACPGRLSGERARSTR